MARRQKLKVFRTPIGFHDAYVAATSRKAALELWGSDADLFARGIAEEVTDDALTRQPLAHPGEVIRRPRGTEAEHLAAAGAGSRDRSTDRTRATDASGSTARRARPPSRKAARPAKPRKPPKPRPSREALDAAEQSVQDLETRYRRDEKDLRAREEEIAHARRALERERRDLERAYARERSAAEAKVDRERERHGTAIERWLASGQDS